MKIRVLSDLHLEFENFRCDDDGVDLVLLAGDIHVGDKGVEWAKATFKRVPVLYTVGNHEYYKQRYPGLIAKLKHAASGSNITILENECVELNDVIFHGCTLWTDFNLFGDPRIAGYECQQVMNDFKKIRKEPSFSKLRSIDVAQIHEKSKSWLDASLLANHDRKNVVITHHGPSIKSVPEHLRSDIVTAAYVSDLENFIESRVPALWVHGHLHNSSDYWIGKTRIVCNPKGYPDWRNPSFDETLVVEV